MKGWFILRPRVLKSDRVPSRRSPPRGRCCCTFSLQIGLGDLEPVGWLALEPMLQQSEDVSTTVKSFKKVLGGVQWYSVLFSQPHSPFLLAGIQVPQHQNNKFRGGHVSTGNSPFPQPEGRRPSWAMIPNGCWFPFHLLVAWSSTSGWLKNYSPNFVGFWIPSLTSAALEERPTVFFGSSSWWAFPCTDLFHRQRMIFSLGLDDLFPQPPMYFSRRSILF